MFKYTGVFCPYCKKEFTEQDQILICPECGAPYHKECVGKSGGCVLTELHEKGEKWCPPATQTDEEKYDGFAPNRCSRCGTINSAEGLFCEVCGTDLRQSNDEHSVSNVSNVPPHQMPYNPFTTPFGGLGPDEEIDNIPVKDLALYVQDNTAYFLPRFKLFHLTQKGSGWNWCAFFLNAYYFIYRKMWGLAAFSLVLDFLLSLPSLIITMKTAMAIAESTLYNPPNALFLVAQLCAMLMWVLKGVFGAFFNKLYTKKVFQRVHKIRNEHKDHPSYTTILTKKGGTSKVGVLLLVILPGILAMISSVILVTSQYIQ